MPYDQVMGKFKTKSLHSGSKTGKIVTNPKQALAILLSEKKESSGKPEYRSKKNSLAKALGKK